jgi:spermidine synthase
MIRWELLDKAMMPGDGGELRLMRRGAEYSIMSGPIELMNSRMSGSEQALATLAAERLKDRPQPVVLIGGLGMGFTLRAAQAAFPARARIVVAEVVPEVVRWAEGPLGDLYGAALADPRLAIHEGDVGELIRGGRAAYDAILLDVDNGPGGLSRAANDRLYDAQGLAAAALALRPGGVLAVWSSMPSSEFSRALKRAGYAADEVKVHAHGKRGARHVIWLATRPR